MDNEIKNSGNKMINFLKKVNNNKVEDHLYSTINPQHFRKVCTPILTKQQDKIIPQKTYKQMMLHRKHHIFIPISRKMKPLQSKHNLYLSVEQKIIIDKNNFSNIEHNTILNKSQEVQNQCQSLRVQYKHDQKLTAHPTISQETKTRFDGRKTVTNGKLYHIPMTSNQLKQKINKNVLSFLKIPQSNKGDMGATLKNFSTFYEFQDYLSKLSNVEKVEGLIQINNTKNKNQHKQKKCSIMPAFHLSGNSKLKKNSSIRKNDMSSSNFNDYMLAKKVRKQIEKSLVVQSKKQELISNMVTKYKNKKNKIQEEKKNHNDGSFEESRNKSIIIQMDEKDIANITGIGIERSHSNQTYESAQKNHNNTSKLKNGTKFSNENINVNITLQGGVYEQKMASYRQFIFIINIAHRVFDPLIIVDLTSLTKMQKNSIRKYYYYVGPGNNSMLIRSLMKRRLWWQQTKNIDEAQFVWTQLKVSTLFEKEQNFNMIKQLQGLGDQVRKLQEELKQSSQESQLATLKKGNKKKINTSMQNILAIQKCIHNPNEQVKNKNVAISNIPKGLMFKAPFLSKQQLKILTQKDAKLYKNSIKSLTNDTTNFENRIKYLPKNYLSPACNEEDRMHNHFEGNHSLGNKKALLHHMLLYYKLTNKPLDKAFPKTYHIRTGENDPQFKIFLQEYKRIEKQQPLSKNIWILKPGQNSNRGNGITVLKQLNKIKTTLRGKQKHKNGQNFTFILQKYIQKPLLYKGRKFDIRHYLIISGLHGKLRAYWYGQGYVRTSSYLFGLSNLNDPMIHLTNDAIQKQSDDYGYYQQGNKISYNQLQKYYTKYFPLKQFSMNKIYSKMRELCIDAINATYFSLDPNKKLHNFEVFGLDFMIDDNLEVNLIEINTNPCLELSSNLLERVIPSMLQQTFRLTIDPLFPPSYHYTNNTRYMAPDCNLQKFQFQLIFDEQRDGVGIRRLYQQNIELYRTMITNLTGSEREQEEIYQNQGEQIEIDKII